MPRTKKFTDHDIAEAKRNRPGKLTHVTGTPCLYIYTNPSPKRQQRWIYRFSQPDGSGIATKSLGPYPAVSLEMAKNRAEQAYRASKVDKINLFEVDWNEGATTTFGEAAKQWLDNRFPGPSKQRREAEHMIFVHAKELVEKPIIKIKPKDIAEVLRPLSKEKPDRFRRVLRRIEAVFGFAKTHQLYFAENPARWKGVQDNLFPGFKNKRGNFAAMPYEDVPEFIHALRQHQNNSVAAVALEFGIHTAARRDEIREMPWSEVDWKNKIWIIPAERMKKGEREHRVPLSPRAIELLKRRYEQRGISDYVFTAHRRPTPIDEKAMLEILYKIDDRYTVHGFRTSFRDWGGDETDYPDHLLEECLSHKVGSGTRRAYRRRTGLEKRRIIMDEWAAYCEGRENFRTQIAEG
jgi:integrase